MTGCSIICSYVWWPISHCSGPGPETGDAGLDHIYTKRRPRARGEDTLQGKNKTRKIVVKTGMGERSTARNKKLHSGERRKPSQAGTINMSTDPWSQDGSCHGPGSGGRMGMPNPLRSRPSWDSICATRTCTLVQAAPEVSLFEWLPRGGFSPFPP